MDEKSLLITLRVMHSRELTGRCGAGYAAITNYLLFYYV